MNQFHTVGHPIKAPGVLKPLLIGCLAIAACNLPAQESPEMPSFSLKPNLSVRQEGFTAQYSPTFQGFEAKQPLNDAASTPQTGGLRVKGLYIIPAGQVEKPRAKEAIAAILAIMQSHYLKMLGVTFEFDPEVSVLRSKNSVVQAVDWDNNMHFIKTNFAQEFLTKRNIVVSVLEGTDGDAGGTGGVLKMTGDFWDDCYDLFINRPHLLSTELAGWSHELGHAFGLMHSSDTKDCLADLDIDMGTLPNLLMEQTGRLGTVYDYPLAKEEKKMLLDSTYCASCLEFRDGRPAPLRYLRLKKGQASQSANGRNVEMIEFHDGSQGRGTLSKDASGKWLERNLPGATRFTFNEVGRDDWSVYLEDRSRNVALQINLFTSKILYGTIGAADKTPIYDIVWSKKK